MSGIRNWLVSFKTAMRGGMQWGRTGGWWSMLLGSTTFDYRAAAGDGRTNAAVMACVRFVQRALPEAPLTVYTRDAQGELAPTPTHALQAILERPNPYYSGLHLIGALAADLMLAGNAYLVKVRARGGRVLELWWVPATTMEPKFPEESTSVYISHYEYRVEGETFELPAENVVHIREGFDPHNVRKGLSPLASLYREVATDNEAANWTASLLRNGAVPGVILSPEQVVTASDEDLEAIKEKYIRRFGGDERGQPLVMGSPTKAQVLSWSPSDMDLAALRNVPEERITAIYGLPAAVVGLGTGLEQTKVGATMREAREQAYESCLPADARVWTERGPKAIVDIGAGERVWAFSDGRLSLHRVTATAHMGRKAVYEVRTKNRVIRATGDHRFLVRESAAGTYRHDAPRGRVGVAWRRLDELGTQDALVIPRSLPDLQGDTLPTGEPASAELMQFLGAFVGDGCTIRGHTISISMPRTDRVRQQYEALAVALFTANRSHRRIVDGSTEAMAAMRAAGSTFAAIGARYGKSWTTVRERIGTHRAPLVGPIAIRDSGNSFVFGSMSGVDQLAALGFRSGAGRKRIPGWVFGLRRDLRLAFLAGMVDSDGTVGPDGKLSVSFANRALALDVRDLLVSVGVPTGAGHATTQSNAHVGAAAKSPTSTRYTVSSTDVAAIAAIPFADPLYRDRLRRVPSRRVCTGGGDAANAGLSADLGFYKVMSIAEVGVQDVFDIEVEGAHSFIADGVVVHNCLIPMQRLIAAELQLQLVPDFGDAARLRVRFNLSEVRVLQDDQNALHERARADLAGGLLTLNQALEMIGQEPLTGAEGDVRFMPGSVTVTPPDRLIPPEPTALPTAPAEDDEEEQEAMPRALAAASRNGHAVKAALGPPLALSESDLDRLSQVTPDDLDNADRFWRRVVDDDLDDLLDARPSENSDA